MPAKLPSLSRIAVGAMSHSTRTYLDLEYTFTMTTVQHMDLAPQQNHCTVNTISNVDFLDVEKGGLKYLTHCIRTINCTEYA